MSRPSSAYQSQVSCYKKPARLSGSFQRTDIHYYISAMKVSGPLGHGRELIGSFGEFHDLHFAEERDINQAWTVQHFFCTSWANNLFSCNTHRWTVRPFPHEHLLVHLLCVEAWVFIFPPDIIFLPGIILVLAAKKRGFPATPSTKAQTTQLNQYRRNPATQRLGWWLGAFQSPAKVQSRDFSPKSCFASPKIRGKGHEELWG